MGFRAAWRFTLKQTKRYPSTWHFRGSPVALDSLVGIAREEIGDTKISVGDLPAGSAPHGIFASYIGENSSRVRVSMPRNTPPGTYKGSAEVGGETYPVEIHVEPHIHLSLSPRQLILDAYAGERRVEDLTIANSGNVACEVGTTHVFGLFDIHGAEHAIGGAFRQSGQSGEKLLELIIEESAKGYAGMVRVAVEEGAGSIAPGAIRQLRLNLHLPPGLKAGHTYTGTLPLHNLRYYVKIRAGKKK
jgi:hypothetical protein